MKKTHTLRMFLRNIPLFCLLVCSVGLFAQQRTTVGGNVKDNNNQALPSVSVSVKGTTRGTTTDGNGNYKIDATASETLVFSFLGFATQETAVGNRSTIDVTLAESTTDLNEVVVVGYGTQKKIDLTGSVASLNLKPLANQPNTNIGQFLQGTIPGLNVGVATSAGGTPPISIRGRVSLNGNQNVLIILDGVQYNGSLSSINPDDVASIDVLKDASSTAIYGAQAANGVILITSKKGGYNQKTRINFTSAYSAQNPTVGNLRPRSRDEFLESMKDAFYRTAFTGSDFTTPNPSFNVASVLDNTMANATKTEPLANNFDWWDAATNTGAIWENNLSVAGGGDKFSYNLSTGLVDQMGFIINDSFKRKSIRAALEAKATNWWKVGLVASGAFVNQDGAEPSLGIIHYASPLLVPFDANGSLIPYPTNTVEPNAFMTYYVDDKDRHNYYFANLYSEIDVPFLSGLKYRINFGQNYRSDQRFYSSVYDANITGRAYKSYADQYDYTFDNIVTYNRAFGKHDLTATLLYGAVERQWNSTFAEGLGFTRLTLSYNDLNSASIRNISTNATREALAYQMARLNYKFADRYLLTATVRRDGYSGFAKNNKTAVFPSAALGWIVSEESFLKNIKAINFLKMRLGYGEIGNQTSAYSSIATVALNSSYVFGDGGNTAFGQQVTALGNDNLKWERTRGLNLGVDFSILNDKLSGNLDFYRNNTYDLLFKVTIPSVTGFNDINTNLGQIRNTGFEASITDRIINSGSLRWSATLNFSTNKNQIISLTGVDADKDGKEDDLVSSGLFIGKSISTIFDYKQDGIYKITDTRLPGFQEGSLKVIDQDGNNDIDAKDRVFIGRREAAYRFSLMNTFDYKGFTLNVFINSVQGGNGGYLNGNTPLYFRDDNSIRRNDFSEVDYWSPRNPDGRYPRIISGSRSKVEPSIYDSRSFIRLQDVSLSYRIPAAISNKIKAQNLSVYVSGKNLATWTKWRGWDPETGEGYVIGGRPVLKTFTAGINIGF